MSPALFVTHDPYGKEEKKANQWNEREHEEVVTPTSHLTPSTSNLLRERGPSLIILEADSPSTAARLLFTFRISNAAVCRCFMPGEHSRKISYKHGTYNPCMLADTKKNNPPTLFLQSRYELPPVGDTS
jgi:hypothetical protein